MRLDRLLRALTTSSPLPTPLPAHPRTLWRPLNYYRSIQQ